MALHDELIMRLRKFRLDLEAGVDEGRIPENLLAFFSECFPESKQDVLKLLGNMLTIPLEKEERCCECGGLMYLDVERDCYYCAHCD